jgi:hypothetical protein
MLRLRSALCAIALAALASGCSSRLDSVEVVGGRLLAYSKGAGESERVLTAGQVVSVNAWLAAHSDGWELDAASYAPELLAILEVREGQSVGLYVYDQWVVYASGSYQRARQSKVDETRALKQALGAPDAG